MNRPVEIGFLSTYVPRELIAAAGFRPRLLRGLESRETDGSLAANLCPYVRRCASFLNGDEGSKLAAIVLTDSCYPMLRLRDLFREKGTLPVEMLLRVPRKHTPEAVNFFRQELDKLAKQLTSLSGAYSGEERLWPVVEQYRMTRDLQRRAADLMLSGSVRGLASGFTTIIDDEHRFTPTELQRRLETLLAGVDRSFLPASSPRLLVAGSSFLNTQLIEVLEKSGAVVSAIDSCAYGRLGTSVSVVVGDDLLSSLATAYLNQPPCLRMCHGQDSLTRTLKLTRRGSFDGALYVLPRNCTPHAYHLLPWRETLRKTGVPVLVLETEDGDWSRPGLLTRIEAFLESLGEISRA